MRGSGVCYWGGKRGRRERLGKEASWRKKGSEAINVCSIMSVKPRLCAEMRVITKVVWC